MSAFHLLPYGISIEENASSQRHVAGKQRAVSIAFLDNCGLSLVVSPPKPTGGLCRMADCNAATGTSTCSAAQSCPTLRDPVDPSPPGSSVRGDSPGKNAGAGCPCPPPRDLADGGIEPASPELAGEIFTTSASWEALSRISLFCQSWIDWCREVCRMSHLPTETASQRETQWTPQETHTFHGDVLPSA